VSIRRQSDRRGYPRRPRRPPHVVGEGSARRDDERRVRREPHARVEKLPGVRIRTAPRLETQAGAQSERERSCLMAPTGRQIRVRDRTRQEKRRVGARPAEARDKPFTIEDPPAVTERSLHPPTVATGQRCPAAKSERDPTQARTSASARGSLEAR